MKWFERQKIGIKLICSFLLVSFVGAVIGILGIAKTAQMNDLATRMYEDEAVGLRHVAEVKIQFMAANQAIRNALLAGSDGERELALVDLRERSDKAKAALMQARRVFVTERGAPMPTRPNRRCRLSTWSRTRWCAVCARTIPSACGTPPTIWSAKDARRPIMPTRCSAA